MTSMYDLTRDELCAAFDFAAGSLTDVLNAHERGSEKYRGSDVAFYANRVVRLANAIESAYTPPPAPDPDPVPADPVATQPAPNPYVTYASTEGAPT